MRLRYQKRALRQIDDALAYVATRSPQGAPQVEARIRAVTHLLLVQSRAGVKTRISGVRRLFLTPYPYFVDYFVGADEIVIQRFRHAARKPT